MHINDDDELDDEFDGRPLSPIAGLFGGGGGALPARELLFRNNGDVREEAVSTPAAASRNYPSTAAAASSSSNASSATASTGGTALLFDIQRTETTPGLTADTRVAKFRNLILRGIDHDADRYVAASQDGGEGGIGPTPLEERSFLLRNQREAAKNAAAQRAAADTERASVRRRLNEGNETFMGIRTSPTDRGVNIPAGAENRPAVANAVQRLGGQPTAIPGGMHVDISYVMPHVLQLPYDSYMSFSFDILIIFKGGTRPLSRAQEQARIAEAAAQGSETVSYGPGERERSSRHTDSIQRIEELAGGLNGDARVLADSMRSIGEAFSSSTARPSESPSKKKHRRFKEITENLKQAMEEKKMLMDLDMSTEDIDGQIKELQEERKLLHRAQGSSAGANLGGAFDSEA